MKHCVCLFLVALLVGCGKPRQAMSLFIWSECIDPAIIADFEREFDCKVTVDLFEDLDGMMAKLAGAGASTYDVIATGNLILPPMIRRGMLAPLRHENIPNLRHIDPQFMNPHFDPGVKYGAPCWWGSLGLFVRRATNQPLEETWGLLFDPARQPGPFILLEDARFTIGAALWYKGLSANTTNAADLAGVRDLLVGAKERSLGFEGYTGCKNRVLSRGAVATIAVNGDAARGIAEDRGTAFFVPREGSGKFMGTLSVSAAAPHRDLAEKFINFILEPRVAARFAKYSQLSTPNRAAMEFIPEADRTNAILYPSAEILRRLEYTDDLGAGNRLYDELWTKIKSR